MLPFFDVIHRRKLLDRRGARHDVGKVFPRMLEAVMQALENEMDPQATRFEINHAQVGKAVEDAAAHHRHHPHEHRHQKRYHAGRIDMGVEIIQRRAGPADMDSEWQIGAGYCCVKWQ